MRCHEVDYEIFGNDLQFVQVELDPGETVIAEAGAMMYMQDSINFEAKLGDGSNPDQGFFGKLFSAGKRVITGDSLFMTHFTNEGSGKKHVSFAAPFPGQIIPVNMAELNGDLICQKDSFLCAALGTQIDIAFTKRLGTGFFGGEGFILQRLKGDGMAFIHACGSIAEIELQDQTIKVDTGCIVGFEESVDYDIARAGGLKSMFLGGEGLFLATLSGTGKVWIQSLPFSTLAERILAHAPKGETGGGKKQGSGSLLGNISNMFEE
jgi:uncharacterized protein (TIGR00266 family)